MSDQPREHTQAVEEAENGQPATAAPCQHFYMWNSPAGSRFSARLCMGCGSPDPEWLNKICDAERIEKQLIREIFSTLVETSDEIEGGQVPGAGWLHSRRSINQWLCDRRDWELTEGVALREEARDAE